MNEEEKKAIKIINDYIERKRATRTVFNTEDIIFDNIIILLGLLEKQTEIEEKNKKDYITKDKIREKIKNIEDIYKKEMKPYQTEYGLNVSLLSKKEKEELINKRNSLLTQKRTLEELLEEK